MIVISILYFSVNTASYNFGGKYFFFLLAIPHGLMSSFLTNFVMTLHCDSMLLIKQSHSLHFYKIYSQFFYQNSMSFLTLLIVNYVPLIMFSLKSISMPSLIG